MRNNHQVTFRKYVFLKSTEKPFFYKINLKHVIGRETIFRPYRPKGYSMRGRVATHVINALKPIWS